MRKFAASILVPLIAGTALPGAALADLPAPVIDKAFQADPLIYDEQMTRLDSNERFQLNLMGKNLAPDDLGHPSNGDYVHLQVRGISPDNKIGKWIYCGGDGDCKFYGSTSRSGISLGMNPNFYLNMPGAHLQFRVWISQGPSDKGTPEEAAATSMVSPWSAIYTVDRAAAGVSKAKPVPVPPVVQRIKPGSFDIVPGRANDWTVLIYGDHLCGGQVGVALNGTVVATPGGCSGVDVDGSFLPAHTSLLKFVLPEGYRRAGDYVLTLTSSDGGSNPVHLVVKAMQMTPIDRPVATPPAVQTIKPVLVRPPIRPN